MTNSCFVLFWETGKIGSSSLSPYEIIGQIQCKSSLFGPFPLVWKAQHVSTCCCVAGFRRESSCCCSKRGLKGLQTRASAEFGRKKEINHASIFNKYIRTWKMLLWIKKILPCSEVKASFTGLFSQQRGVKHNVEYSDFHYKCSDGLSAVNNEQILSVAERRVGGWQRRFSGDVMNVLLMCGECGSKLLRSSEELTGFTFLSTRRPVQRRPIRLERPARSIRPCSREQYWDQWWWVLRNNHKNLK